MSAPMNTTVPTECYLTPSCVSGKNAHDTQALPSQLESRTQQVFQRCLEQVESHQPSTDGIPLTIQKELLAHFTEKARLQEISNKHMENAGSFGGIPPYMSEHLLNHYLQRVDLLQHSINALESANAAALDSREIKLKRCGFFSNCFPCFG